MKKFIGLLLTILVTIPAWAKAGVTPEAQTKIFTDKVITIILNDHDLQTNGKVATATDTIDRTVLQPHFNFNRMTSLAMGKEWRKASAEQKETLIREFKTLMVKTYSSALTVYTKPTVNFKKSRYRATDTEVQIRTQVIQPGHNAVDIDYVLEKRGDEWKVFDVVVAGVSLVTNYRDFFTQEVRNGGIEGAIKSLQTKNQEPAKK
ncbi:MAG: ABC transporter substrate-binding protein [Proteobacteria bacterium]|nr:ABC transporter substrate-binding protein [Pseudomonadota bacterium]